MKNLTEELIESVEEMIRRLEALRVVFPEANIPSIGEEKALAIVMRLKAGLC